MIEEKANFQSAGGAFFKLSEGLNSAPSTASFSSTRYQTAHFSAQAENSIYANSSTVQPPAYQALMIIRA